MSSWKTGVLLGILPGLLILPDLLLDVLGRLPGLLLAVLPLGGREEALPGSQQSTGANLPDTPTQLRVQLHLN